MTGANPMIQASARVVDPDYAAMAPFPFAPPTDADAHAARHHAQCAGSPARHIDS
jgi:hypothetical protein